MVCLDFSKKILMWEKEHYKFANYSKANKKCVIMPGCNFTSFSPKTTQKLEEFSQKFGFGFLYECCGMPLCELGENERACGCAKRINEKLERAGVEELVLCCPNCYHFFKENIDIKCVTIYEKLCETKVGKKIETRSPKVFVPCPEVGNLEMLGTALPFFEGDVCFPFKKIPCCHVKSRNAKDKPTLQKKLMSKMKDVTDDIFYTYCATCACYFQRNGITNWKHILPEILGVKEEFPGGIKPFCNRAIKKFR